MASEKHSTSSKPGWPKQLLPATPKRALTILKASKSGTTNWRNKSVWTNIRPKEKSRHYTDPFRNLESDPLAPPTEPVIPISSSGPTPIYHKTCVWRGVRKASGRRRETTRMKIPQRDRGDSGASSRWRRQRWWRWDTPNFQRACHSLSTNKIFNTPNLRGQIRPLWSYKLHTEFGPVSSDAIDHKGKFGPGNACAFLQYVSIISWRYFCRTGLSCTDSQARRILPMGSNCPFDVKVP
jgi:hypothetical protein